MEKVKVRIALLGEEYGKIVTLAILLSVFLIIGSTIYHVTKDLTLRVSFLDIGQGDAILITTPSGKQMLIDGGPTNHILEELSKELGYFDQTLDVLVATHPDSDHVTGLIPVLKKYKVSTVITSNVSGSTGVFNDLTEKIKSETKDIHVAQKGDIIDFGDGVEAFILHPDAIIAKDTNDGSVSMVIRYKGTSFLLTGDLSENYEPLLIGDSLPQHITVYKAGHHGSKTSSGKVLLSYIHPEYSVISAGKKNDYGHPHQETMARLQNSSKEILSTIDRGTITFTSDGEQLTVVTDK